MVEVVITRGLLAERAWRAVNGCGDLPRGVLPYGESAGQREGCLSRWMLVDFQWAVKADFHGAGCWPLARQCMPTELGGAAKGAQSRYCLEVVRGWQMTEVGSFGNGTSDAYNGSMAQEDFDIDRLAAYLHIMPAAVLKLAERGKIPARRVGGEWRFSAAEIHHWLEERIGVSDEQELVQMEGALDRATGQSRPEEVSIADLMHGEAIEIPLEARTHGAVIDRMAELAARTGLLWDAEKMAEAVRAREAMHTTALDNGVALLHPRRPMPAILGEALVALGVTPRGIPFGGGGNLTDIFFLICSTTEHKHLRILARLSRVINDPEFLAALRSAESASALHQLIRDREAALRA